jgi:ferredoxin-NADP reductase/Na+-translocating ferredoxin:NAD+ oxidoreductase RnfD subunit
VKQWLDRITGKFTMYRTVLILLLAVTANAFVLSFVGVIFYKPLELLVSGAVAVGVSMGASTLMALAFRTKPHLESSAITGLLLFIILLPSLEADKLAFIALAALVASVSKYLFAWRGRHIFNPAAIGAVVVTVPSLTYGVWWVGAPLMLPIVALSAFIILYRTRRIEMGVVYIVVALAVYAVRWTMTGQGALAGIEAGLLSSFFVFFAGFMLSEPLTMPPLKKQQLGYAVTIALLSSLSFNLGPLHSSPQLALIVGNIIAFFFGQRRGIRLTLVEKKQLTPTTWEFTFRPANPVRFTPGQYMELTVPHKKTDQKGVRRVFSISSAPGVDAPLTFALKVEGETVSSFKRALLDLAPGSAVRGTLVAGDFMLPNSLETPILLVAGGIGITPFASQIAHDHARGLDRDVVVAYAVSDPAELAYSDLLKKSGARVIVTAPTKPARLPKGWVYAGTRLTREVVEQHVPDVAARRAYISGPPSLVNALRVTLRKLGSRRITTDYFSGY